MRAFSTIVQYAEATVNYAKSLITSGVISMLPSPSFPRRRRNVAGKYLLVNKKRTWQDVNTDHDIFKAAVMSDLESIHHLTSAILFEKEHKTFVDSIILSTFHQITPRDFKHKHISEYVLKEEIQPIMQRILVNANRSVELDPCVGSKLSSLSAWWVVQGSWDKVFIQMQEANEEVLGNAYKKARTSP